MFKLHKFRKERQRASSPEIMQADRPMESGGVENPGAKSNDGQRVQEEGAFVRRFDGDAVKVIYNRARASLARKGRLRAVVAEELDPRLRASGSWYDEVRDHGVCAIPDFLSPEQCGLLRDEVGRLFDDYMPAIQVISNGADRRIFGAENGSAAIREYAESVALDSICQLWLGPGSSLFCVMVNQLNALPGNCGSGGQGWHRDSLTSQIKTITYLNDVGRKNGPYEYIRGSHRTGAFLRDTRNAGVPMGSIKFRDENVKRMLEEEPDRLMTFEAKAGTLIIADTTGIHRGASIEEGVRCALTTYTFPRTRKRRASQAMLNHYKPILGVHVPARVC